MTQGESLARLVLGNGSRDPSDEPAILAAFRRTAMRAHPDHGGNAAWFVAVVAARDLLLEGSQDEPDAESQEPQKPPPPPPDDEGLAPEEFLRERGWRVSAAGNSWRRCSRCGEVATVFRDSKRGTFLWRHGPEGYGRRRFEREVDAIEDFETTCEEKCAAKAQGGR